VRALKAAGLSIKRVELDNGKVTAVTEDEATGPANPWDAETAKLQAKK
jgi:hypothetical protein